jgi:predicted transcriptional regulator
MNILISIKPCFCNLILDGQKRYEYRKRVFSRSDVSRVYVYASKPICKVIGYFTVKRIINDTPSMIWNQTHEHGGITKKLYQEYFKGHTKAYAIEIDKVVKIAPIDPKQALQGFTAPQNFMYLDEDL